MRSDKRLRTTLNILARLALRARGMHRRLGLAGLVCAIGLVAACASRPWAGPPSMRTARSSDAAPVLLLGEVHDNADGHRQRFALLAARVQAGWRPAIALEQFDRERQAELDQAMATCPDADCVVDRAGPVGVRWAWQHYRPVIDLARQHRLRLLAANVSRADAGRIVREGFGAALDAGTIAAYGLDRPLPAMLVAGQRREIVEGHCGQLPAGVIDGMVRAQVARDVWMAKVVSAQAARGVVLLAGNGHVRKDYGVARWLTGRAADDAYSIGFVESPSDAHYDEIRIIQSESRDDSCAVLGGSTAR